MYYLINTTRRTGKINVTLESEAGTALLNLWALQNTKPSQDTYIFDDEGNISRIYKGRKDRLPEIDKVEGAENIEDYCPGILLALSEEVSK